MANQTNHDFNDGFQPGDTPWDHTEDMSKLNDIVAYISADGETIFPPNLKADAPQVDNDVARKQDIDPLADRDGDNITPAYLGAERLEATDTADITVSVPTDFSSLSAALDAAALRKLPSGTQVVITIESGHQISDTISCVDGDWSHIRIESADATVGVDGSALPDSELIYGDRADLPILAATIDCSGHTGDGLFMRYSRFACDTAGIINAGGSNVSAYGSEVFAPSCDFYGAGERGIWLQRASNATVSHCDVSNCDFGLFALGASNAMFRQGDATGCNRGVVANQRSNVSAHGADFSNGTGIACVLSSQMSIIDARNAIMNPVGSNWAFFSRRGGRALGDLTEIYDPAKGAYYVERGGMIQAWNTKGNAAGAWAPAEPNYSGGDGERTGIPYQEGVWTTAGIVIADGMPWGERSWDQLAFRGVKKVDQSINAGNQTKVQFNSADSEVRAEPGGYWSEDNYNYIAQHDGWYNVEARARFTGSTSGDQLRLIAGSTGNIGSTDTVADIVYSDGNDAHLKVSGTVPVDRTDTISLWVQNQDSADTIQGIEALTYFEIGWERAKHPDEP